MLDVEAKAKPETIAPDREIAWSPDPVAGATPRRRRRLLPVLLTVLVAAAAVVLGQAMWNAYMAAPWTRDGTVRAYVVTMAPEVSGRIVELPVADNQFVHEGDLLMVIDPTNYKIAVNLAKAAVPGGRDDRDSADRSAPAPVGAVNRPWKAPNPRCGRDQAAARRRNPS
jgi:multidrug efflux pump subunit AcrA (membrane-fusion protein)